MKELISLSEARAKGLTRYFTGKPCIHGHISERAVSVRACIECHRIEMDLRQTRNPKHARALDKKSRALRDPKGRKADMTPEQWEKSLAYFKVKNHERRDGAIGVLSQDIREQLFISQDGLCKGCETILTTSCHLDHIFALSRGGSNTDDNVQLLCATCNLSKGSKTMQEWKSI